MPDVLLDLGVGLILRKLALQSGSELNGLRYLMSEEVQQAIVSRLAPPPQCQLREHSPRLRGAKLLGCAMSPLQDAISRFGSICASANTS